MKHSKLILGATGLFLAIAGAFATKASNHVSTSTVWTGTTSLNCHSHSGHVGCNNSALGGKCLTNNVTAKTSSSCANTLKTGGVSF